MEGKEIVMPPLVSNAFLIVRLKEAVASVLTVAGVKETEQATSESGDNEFIV